MAGVTLAAEVLEVGDFGGVPGAKVEDSLGVCRVLPLASEDEARVLGGRLYTCVTLVRAGGFWRLYEPPFYGDGI